MAGAVEAFRRRAGGWPGGLSGGRECRALAGVFPQGGSGFRLVGLGCVVEPGAGAGRRMVWKGSGWRLSELGATGSGAEGGA